MRRDELKNKDAGVEHTPQESVPPQSDAPVLKFPTGVALTTLQRDQTFMLLTSDATRGLLRFAPWGEPLPSHTRKVFVVADRRFGPVKIYAQVLGPATGEHADTCIVVRWILLTATEQRRNLTDALERLLGVKTAVGDAEEHLGPHRKLIYDAETQRVQLIWVESSDAKARDPSADSAPDSRNRLRTRSEVQRETRYGDAIPAPPERKTQPRILVQLSEPSEAKAISMEALEVVLAQETPTPSPRYNLRASTEPIFKTPVLPVPKASSPPTKPVGGLGFSRALGGRIRKRRPLYPCRDLPGSMALSPEEPNPQQVVVSWIGHDACVFTVDVVSVPELGRSVSVGISTTSDARSPIWIQGVVALITVNQADRSSMVELDIQGQELPPSYVALVEDWKALDTTRQDT